MSLIIKNQSLDKAQSYKNPNRLRLDYLDGMRGLAALFVVMHHLWQSYTMDALPGIAGLTKNWLLYGHLSVDVFIVLSGACLMLPVVRSGSLRGGWQFFYKSRAKRILPPLYIALGFAVATHLFRHDIPFTHIRHALIPNILLLQDLLPATNILDVPLWSVALEWRIYILFPLFVWIWARYGSVPVLLLSAVIGYGLAAVLTLVDPSLPQNLACSWYVFLFAMGMAATDVAARVSTWPRWLLPSLLSVSLAVLALMLSTWRIGPLGEMHTPYLYLPHLPLIDAVAGMVTAFVLVLLSHQSASQKPSLLLRLLSWKPFVFLGTIGYSLYLIHALVIFQIKALLTSVLFYHSPSIIIALDTALVIPIAYLFHLAFERPFMNTKPGTKIRTETQAEVAAAENPAP